MDGETKVQARAKEKEMEMEKGTREKTRAEFARRRVGGGEGERNEWRLQTTRERRMVRNPWRKRGRDKGEEDSSRERKLKGGRREGKGCFA